MIAPASRAACLLALALLSAHEVLAQERDAGTPAPSTDAGVDAAVPRVNPAAEARTRALIERQAEVRCAAELKSLRYHEAQPSPQNQQLAVALRELAEGCMNRARAGLQRQAEDQADMAIYFQRQAKARALAEQERAANAARVRAQREKQERDKAAQEAADQQATEAQLKNPGYLRAVLSAQLCYVASSRKHAKQMIDNERQGAREGLGVIDKEEVYKWQGELVILSKLEGLTKASIKGKRFVPLPCNADAAKHFADCIDGARQQPMYLSEGDDEYLASATRIVDFAPGCLGDD